MYANGQGVPQDYVQAHKWFNLAAASRSGKAFRDMAVEVVIAFGLASRLFMAHGIEEALDVRGHGCTRLFRR